MDQKVYDFKVESREDFILFLNALHKDFLKNSKDWENRNLSDFLQALSAYAEDIQGYYDNSKININADDPNWKTFADIFKGAIVYE